MRIRWNNVKTGHKNKRTIIVAGSQAKATMSEPIKKLADEIVTHIKAIDDFWWEQNGVRLNVVEIRWLKTYLGKTLIAAREQGASELQAITEERDNLHNALKLYQLEANIKLRKAREQIANLKDELDLIKEASPIAPIIDRNVRLEKQVADLIVKVEELEAYKQDAEDNFRRVITDKRPHDEIHCSCVVDLRKHIDILTAQLEQIASKNTCSSYEHVGMGSGLTPKWIGCETFHSNDKNEYCLPCIARSTLEAQKEKP